MLPWLILFSTRPFWFGRKTNRIWWIVYIETGGRTDWEPARLVIPLLGFHQVENAATAYAAIQTLKNRD